jgi:tRNA-2-methylthio-N6-dimethylallyladenosine synthase
VLLNTCSVREKAEDKVYSQLGLWKYLKRQKPSLIIGVGGCVASQEGDGIVQRATAFKVSQGGVVFQKDPGPDTQKLATAITAFDPDRSWAAIVDE